jgi:multicomponent Na+:H+ antiporter subunit C
VVSGVEPYLLAGAVLFAVGLHGLTVRPHLLQKVLAFNVMGNGVFLLLVTLAPRMGTGAPDPVPQAMVLTGIVVAVSATALALALVRRVQEVTREPTLPEDVEGTPAAATGGKRRGSV